MTTFLVIVSLCLAFLHEKQAKLTILVFILTSLIYQFIGITISNEDGAYYYLCAALLDLGIIKYLSCFHKVTTILTNIQTICLLFICNNFVGWIIYEMGITSVVYDTLSDCLYLAMIYIITPKGICNGIKLGINSYWDIFRLNINSCNNKMSRD